MNSLFNQLVNVRSLKAESVIDFLRQYAATLNEAPPFVKSLGLSATQLEVEQWVWTEKHTASPGPRGGGDTEKAWGERSELDKVVQELYEIRGGAERREERWANVVRRPKARLILLGAPGQGKTFSTKATVLKIVATALAEIVECRRTPEEVPVAVWVKAAVLARTGARNLVEALLAAMKAEANGTPITALNASSENWLRGRLATGQALVVVDSLDEVEPSLCEHFRAKEQMLAGYAGSVVLTCRTLNWQERSGWVNQTSLYREVELVPFKPRQQREFAQHFFPQPTDQRRINHLLNTNHAMRYAARTPLLMTFFCLGFRNGEVNEATTYTGLYGIVLHNLMSGAWKGAAPRWGDNAILRARYLKSLARVVWRLFTAAPEANRFSDEDWQEAEIAAEEEYGKRWTALPPTADFIKELENLGLLIPAGLNEDKTSPCYSFSHRSFLDYLAARGLSEQKDWLEILYPHLWFEAGWVEVSKFVVGLVSDATPLLERLDAEAEDIFGWKLYLQCRVMGFAKRVEEARRSQVEAAMQTLLWQGTYQLPSGREAVMLDSLVFPAYRELALGPALNDMKQPLVEALAYDTHGWARERAANTLGQLGDINAPVLTALLSVLAHDADDGVRTSAAEALGQLGDTSVPVLTALLSALARDAHDFVRASAASALGQLGDTSAHVLTALLSALAPYAEGRVRASAASALGRLGDTSVPVLTALLFALDDADAHDLVRESAAVALGQLGETSAPVLAVLLTALASDADGWARQRAARALEALGDTSAPVLDALLTALAHDADSVVRTYAAEALGQLGVRLATQLKGSLVHGNAAKIVMRDNLTRIIEGLLAAQHIRGAARAALWSLMWQLPPEMKAQYRPRLHAKFPPTRWHSFVRNVWKIFCGFL